MNKTLDQQIEDGTAWLDDNAPGWEWKIDTETLSMVNNCVLDQVFSDLEERAFDVIADVKGLAWITEHGFSTMGRDLWIDAINARRGLSNS